MSMVRPGRKREKQIQHAKGSEGDVSEPNQPPPKGGVAAQKIISLEEEAQARAGHEGDQEESPAGVPIPDMEGGGHDGFPDSTGSE
jgi:hypothetical protein